MILKSYCIAADVKTSPKIRHYRIGKDRESTHWINCLTLDIHFSNNLYYCRAVARGQSVPSLKHWVDWLSLPIRPGRVFGDLLDVCSYAIWLQNQSLRKKLYQSGSILFCNIIFSNIIYCYIVLFYYQWNYLLKLWFWSHIA